MFWIIEIRAKIDIKEWYVRQNTRWGCLWAFSNLHRKLSVRWVCNILSLKQTSENICSPDVSTSSVLVYFVCGYCPCGTSINVSKLIHRVIYCTDIEKSLLTCIQVCFALKFHDGAISNAQTSEKNGDLAQAAPATQTDVFCLAYTHLRALHRFLSVVQSRSHSSPFSVSDR